MTGSDGAPGALAPGPRRRGGFAGFFALRALQQRLPADAADLVLVNPTDYLLYSPLLPEVATGVVEARHIAVSLRRALPRVRLVLGRATDIDLAARTATVRAAGPGIPGAPTTLAWDRLAITPGSVTRQLPIPGVAEHGRGLKTLVEAVFLRDHLLGQLDLADAQPDAPAGRAERDALLTVVAGSRLHRHRTRGPDPAVAAHHRAPVELDGRRRRPLDARRRRAMVLPELGPDLGRRALALLRRRGVDVRLSVRVESVHDRSVGSATARRWPPGRWCGASGSRPTR